jgi:hypothetical protein
MEPSVSRRLPLIESKLQIVDPPKTHHAPLRQTKFL